MASKEAIIRSIDDLKSKGYSWSELARELNSTYGDARSSEAYRKLYKRGSREKITLTPRESDRDLEDGTIVRTANGDVIATRSINENPANLSIEEIVRLFDLDTRKWECIGYSAKAWNALVRGSDKTNVIRNYSVKATFRPTVDTKPTEEDIRWVFDLSKSLNKEEQVTTISDNSDNVLVLPIFDVHLGKLAWGKESGENYDLKIASSRFRNAVNSIVIRAADVGFSKIIFPLGNDFFQFDNPASETTRGTRVDSDLRWKKMFKVGVDLLKEALDFCKRYAPVDVILVQGNHDNTMSFYAFEALRGWYDGDKNITIDNNIQTRTYRRVGVNLLGFTHGDKEKDNLYRIMQQEARDMWGKTKYSEWIIGHYHRSYVDEKQGVTKRVVGSFSGTDAWHYEHGYVGTTRSAQGIIYNKKQPGPYLIIYEDVG